MVWRLFFLFVFFLIWKHYWLKIISNFMLNFEIVFFWLEWQRHQMQTLENERKQKCRRTKSFCPNEQNGGVLLIMNSKPIHETDRLANQQSLQVKFRINAGLYSSCLFQCWLTIVLFIAGIPKVDGTASCEVWKDQEDDKKKRKIW